MGKDVFMVLDSITRLARAFNKWVGNTGRTMSGGVDIKAMDIPKKLFATARAVACLLHAEYRACGLPGIGTLQIALLTIHRIVATSAATFRQ